MGGLNISLRSFRDDDWVNFNFSMTLETPFGKKHARAEMHFRNQSSRSFGTHFLIEEGSVIEAKTTERPEQKTSDEAGRARVPEERPNALWFRSLYDVQNHIEGKSPRLHA